MIATLVGITIFIAVLAVVAIALMGLTVMAGDFVAIVRHWNDPEARARALYRRGWSTHASGFDEFHQRPRDISRTLYEEWRQRERRRQDDADYWVRLNAWPRRRRELREEARRVLGKRLFRSKQN